MDLTYVEVPIGALDTAIDPAVAPPGTITICDNASADSPGIYEKRKGYTAISSPGTLRRLAARGGQILAVSDADGVVSMHDGASAWTPLAGSVGAAQTTQQAMSLEQDFDATKGTRATANGVTVHAFQKFQGLSIRLVDAASGGVFYEQIAEFVAVSFVHAVVTGNNILVVYSTGGQTLRMVKVDAAARTVAAAITFQSGANVNAALPVFDVCPINATDILIAWYSNTPNVRVSRFNTASMTTSAGATVMSAEVVDSGLAIVGTTAEFGAILYHGTAAGGMRAACFNVATTAQTVAPFMVEAVVAPAGQNCGLVRVDSTHVLAVWDRAATGILKQKVQWAQVSSAGVVSALCGPLFNVALASKPFLGGSGNTTYVSLNVWAPYSLQYTFFTVRIPTFSGAPFCFPSAMHAYRGAWKAASILGQLSDVDTVATKKYAFSGPISYKFLSTSSPRAGWATFGIDYASATLYRHVEAIGDTFFASGASGKTDGTAVSEVNFLLYPEITQATAGAVGALGMDNGTYSYIAVFEASDGSGNTDRSTTSLAVSATTAAGAGLGKVTLTIDQLTVTGWGNGTGTRGNIAIFRTKAAGTTYFFIGYASISTSAANVVYTDQANDSTIGSNRILYTAGGVLDREPPLPCSQLLLHKNRIWGISSADPKALFYSGELSPGEGAWFSSLQQLRVDSGGDITAIATMDDSLVVYKADRIFKVFGSGANALGQNSDLTAPIPTNTDAGATDWRSVVAMGSGTMYRNPKGIQLLSRGAESGFAGAPVQTYVDAASNVMAAVLLNDAREVRFELDTGVKVVYNYGTKRWTTHTNYLGQTAQDAIVVGGVYYWSTASGQVYKESATSFLDPAGTFVPMRVQLAWIAPAGRQGLVRVRKALLLADRKDPHDLTITTSVNYSAAAPLVSPLTNVVLAALAREQIRVSLTSQKVESVRVEIVDAVSSGGGATVTGQGYALRGLAFLAGVKKGAFDKRMVNSAKV